MKKAIVRKELDAQFEYVSLGILKEAIFKKQKKMAIQSIEDAIETLEINILVLRSIRSRIEANGFEEEEDIPGDDIEIWKEENDQEDAGGML